MWHFTSMCRPSAVRYLSLNQRYFVAVLEDLVTTSLSNFATVQFNVIQWNMQFSYSNCQSLNNNSHSLVILPPFWPHNAVKPGICYQNVCPSVCLSQLWLMFEGFKIMKYTSNHTMKVCFWLPEATFCHLEFRIHLKWVLSSAKTGIKFSAILKIVRDRM